MSKWDKMPMGKAICFNPAERISIGTEAKKIPMGNLTEFQRKINGFEWSEYKSGPKFRNNDTLLAKITPCLENGKTAYVDILEDDEVAFGSSEFIVLRKTKYTDSEFIYYLSISSTFRNRAISCMEGTSGRQRVNENTLKNFELPFPTLKEQKQIAKVLSDLDAKIEVNNKINQELEALAKTIYDYWFVQFDFPDANGKPYKSTGGKMVYNEVLKREIPEGWDLTTLEQIADTGSGGTPLSTKLEYYKGGTIPWINSGEVNKPFITSTKNFITVLGLKNSSAKIFPNGSLLMAMYGATAGKVSLIAFEAATNQAICAIMPYDEIYKYYLKFSLEILYKYLVNLSSGSARDNLSQAKIRALSLISPKVSVLKKYFDLVNSMMELILKNQKQNEKLAELRDWLLPMLMNGQVTVSEAKEQLGMVAETGAAYERDKEAIDSLFDTINYDYEVGVVVLLTRQILDRRYGKKYVHKMLSNIQFLEELPVFKDLAFKENGWGMHSKILDKTITNQKYVYFEDLGNDRSVLNFNYKHIKEVSDWMQKDEYGKDFVLKVENMLKIYQKSLINKNMDRIELFNTVLECMAVLETDSFEVVRRKMGSWKMHEEGYDTKADKFTPYETQLMIDFIKEQKGS